MNEQFKPPIERECGTCRWFEFATGPTGRKRPAEKGHCRWPVPWPEQWPDSYRDYLTSSLPVHPIGMMMFHWEGANCKTWLAKEGQLP
jgi:hypothetical protein